MTGLTKLKASAMKAYHAGYCPLPVNGKRPIAGRGWNKPENLTSPDVWTNEQATGFGILTGTQAGAHPVIGEETVLIAIDIDLMDDEDIDICMQALPTTPMAKRGRRGVTLFYRTQKSLASSGKYTGARAGDRGVEKLHIADFLGLGKQTVMPPSLHSDGLFYEWLDGCGLVPARDLPIIDAADIRDFEEVIAAVFNWGGSFVTERKDVSATVNSIGSNTADDYERWSEPWLNINALNDLKAWVPDLGLPKTQWTGAGYTAVNVLRGSSTGRRLEERGSNLRFHRTGIRDFGSEVGYTPLDLVKQIRGEEQAWSWLVRRIDPEGWDEINGAEAQAGLEQMLALGRERRAAEAAEGHRKAQEMLNGDGDHRIDLSNATVEFDMDALKPIPDDLMMRAPGFMGRMHAAIRLYAPFSPPSACAMATLAFASMLCQRRYDLATDANSSTTLSLYTIVLADTGSGKEAPKQFVKSMINKLGVSKSEKLAIPPYKGEVHRWEIRHDGKDLEAGPGLKVRSEDGSWQMAENQRSQSALVGLRGMPDDFTGESAVVSALWSSAVSLLLMDELGDAMRRWVKEDDAGRNSIFRTLRTLFYRQDSYVPKGFSKMNRAQHSPLTNRAINEVTPSLLGMSTPRQLFAAMSKQMAENGSLNRFCIARDVGLETNSRDDQMRYLVLTGERREVPDDLVNEAMTILTRGLKPGHMIAEIGEQGPTLRYVNEVDQLTDPFDIPPERIMIEYGDEALEIALAHRIRVGRLIAQASAAGDEAKVQAWARSREMANRIAVIAAVCDHKTVIEASHARFATELAWLFGSNLEAMVRVEIGVTDRDLEDAELGRQIAQGFERAISDGKFKPKAAPEDPSELYFSKTALLSAFSGNKKRRASKLLDELTREDLGWRCRKFSGRVYYHRSDDGEAA